MNHDTESEKTPITDELRYGDWAITWLSAQLSVIVKTARDARSQHSVQGHHCELRAAIDSICDREPDLLEHIRQVSAFFQTSELREVNRLEMELATSQRESQKLRTAIEKVIQMNRDTARLQFGDANKAEEFTCNKVLRAALPVNVTA